MLIKFFIIIPSTREILKFDNTPGTFGPIIDELERDRRPSNLVYYNGFQMIDLERDDPIDPFFPERYSQVLILAFDDEQIDFTFIPYSEDRLVFLLVSDDLQRIIPVVCSTWEI